MCAASDPGCVNPRRVSRTAPGRAESITFCIKDLRRHLQSRVLMSAKGQKRTLQCILVMSALPPKADMDQHSPNVRFVPTADIHIRSPNCRCWYLSVTCPHRSGAMADLAYDASGPASSEPTGIALQQANRPFSSDNRGKLRVFISYSREDLNFADQLDAALSTYGFECLVDRHGISGGEDWKQRLGDLISEADTVVFVLSPSSARSEICDWEVEEAARLNKRILPVNWRPLEGVSSPPRLRELNYIFFYEEPKLPGSGFGTGLASLIAALNTDFDWLREHTRYLQRAIEWDTGGRPANRLLSGDDIAEAKTWVARRPKGAPEPTALHLDFIRASEEEAEARLSEQRKQLEVVAGAQEAREKALNDREEALKQATDAQRRHLDFIRASEEKAEARLSEQRAQLKAVAAAQAAQQAALHYREDALKQATDAQRRRARIRNIGLIAASSLATVAVLFALLANQQRITAEKQRHQADTILARATNIIGNLQFQMDIETKREAFSLLQAGAEHGDSSSMANLGGAYHLGLGVAQDYAKAREWYEKAAANGNAIAMNNLGTLYAYGHGVAQDYAKAREWYEKAAAKDNASAMFNLGSLYKNGHGVAQDYAKAREWYEKAAANGDKDAKAQLDKLPN